MIPILYPSTETAFTGNGLGRLVDCISCEVTEVRDTWEFSCVFKYPVNADMFPEIKIGRIVLVDSDSTKAPQPFDIYAYDVDIEGIATFYANHVSYRLSRYICKKASWDERPFNVIADILADPYVYSGSTYVKKENHYNKLASVPGYDFSAGSSTYHCDGFYSHLSYAHQNDITWYYRVKAPKSARDVLFGTDGSLSDVYHLEYEFDKFSVFAYGNGYSRGVSRPITIRYSNNMTGMEYEYDKSNTVMAIIPYWVDPETETAYTISDLGGVEVGEGIYDDTIIANKDYKIGEEFEATAVDLSEYFSSRPTGTKLYNQAKRYYANNALGNAHESLSVDFVRMYDSPEYREVSAAQLLCLCDTAAVLFAEIGLAKPMRVCKTVYDPLASDGEGRYTSMEFGSTKRTLYTVSLNKNTDSTEDSDQYQIDPGGAVIGLDPTNNDDPLDVIGGDDPLDPGDDEPIEEPVEEV